MMSRQRRAISARPVFQNYALYPHMTIRENMEFALSLKKVPKPQIDAKVMRAAEILGLKDLLTRYPRQLVRRSAPARLPWAARSSVTRRSFCSTSRFRDLDAKLRVQMRAEIKALHQRLKTTTVYVTHDQVEAMTYWRTASWSCARVSSSKLARRLSSMTIPLISLLHSSSAHRP